MARTAKQDVKPDFVDESATDEPIDMGLLTTAPAEWEFETVRDQTPTRIDFTDIGDSVILKFIKMEHIERPADREGKDQSFDLYIWEGRDGNPYSINTSFALEEAISTGGIVAGDWCRLTYIKDVETSRGLNAMKDIKIEKRRVPAQPTGN